jgi:hypothetical protein
MRWSRYTVISHWRGQASLSEKRWSEVKTFHTDCFGALLSLERPAAHRRPLSAQAFATTLSALLSQRGGAG